jgi:hypothetical protein
MRFVTVKSAAQQAALLHHRVRDLLVRQRIMLITVMRRLPGKTNGHSAWDRALLERGRPFRLVSLALANSMARVDAGGSACYPVVGVCKN